MTATAHVHETSMSIVQTALAELDAGTDMALKVKVSCSSACDLRGNIVKIIAQDAAVVKEIELVTFDGMGNETDEFVVKAPTKSGEHAWTAAFPGQEKEGILHEEIRAPFSFTVKPHATSMAVWDVPSPIVLGDAFRIKVGVTCSARCKLVDQRIEIYDHEGASVATGTLGDVPWPGVDGYYSWKAKFPMPDSELPHEGASYAFGFAAARRPEHVVTVEIIDKDTKTPIKNADILLHRYGSYADEQGVARVRVPKGEYQFWVSKEGYETFQATVKVASNVAITAALVCIPPDPNTTGG